MYSARPSARTQCGTSQRAVGSKMVAYARKGHGVRERDRQLDLSRRAIGCFDRYLGTLQ
jgi:hypothetical protein